MRGNFLTFPGVILFVKIMRSVLAVPAVVLSTIWSGELCPAAERARFEVASIRPVEAVETRRSQAMDFARNSMPAYFGLPLQGRRVDLRNYSLSQLISIAFRIPSRRVVGPQWLSAARFDIEAILPSDAPVDKGNEMLQMLLEERFGLTTSNSSREQSGFLLTVRKAGPSLKAASHAPAGSDPPNAADLVQKMRKSGPAGSSRYEYKRYGTVQFAEALAGLLQNPVEDRTGLKEKYDFVIDIPPPLDSQDNDPQSRILEAVRKLGLDLKGGKVISQVLVVESIQKVPTPN